MIREKHLIFNKIMYYVDLLGILGMIGLAFVFGRQYAYYYICLAILIFVWHTIENKINVESFKNRGFYTNLSILPHFVFSLIILLSFFEMIVLKEKSVFIKQFSPLGELLILIVGICLRLLPYRNRFFMGNVNLGNMMHVFGFYIACLAISLLFLSVTALIITQVVLLPSLFLEITIKIKENERK